MKNIYNDGYCNMLDTKEARYCADPGLIEEERQFEVDQNKLSVLQELCDRYSGEMRVGGTLGGSYKDTDCKLPEGYLIPLKNAFELRDKIASTYGITRRDILEITSNFTRD